MFKYTFSYRASSLLNARKSCMPFVINIMYLRGIPTTRRLKLVRSRMNWPSYSRFFRSKFDLCIIFVYNIFVNSLNDRTFYVQYFNKSPFCIWIMMAANESYTFTCKNYKLCSKFNKHSSDQ